MNTQPAERLVVSREQPVSDPLSIFWSLESWNHLTWEKSQPEASFTQATVHVGPQDLDSLRWLLRDVDASLQCNAVLTVLCEESIGDYVAAELLRVLGHRYLLSSETGNRSTYVLTKNSPLFNQPQDNRSWTIGLMSGGSNDPRIQRVIDSISANRFENVELLIVGPAPGIDLPTWARHIPFSEDFPDCRFPICVKKNLVAREARYENLLIVHDRIFLHPEWWNAMQQSRTDWELLLFPAKPEGAEHQRLADWTHAENLNCRSARSARLSEYYRSYPFDYSNLRHSNLPYQQAKSLIVLNGSCFAVRRSVLLRNPLPENLHWGEIEDGHWSMQLYNSGKVVSLAPSAKIFAVNEGRFHSRASILPAIALDLMSGARLALRRQCYSAAQKALELMNREQDMFFKRGAFSKSIGTLNCPTPEQIKSFNWNRCQGLMIRNIFETEKDIRRLLNALSESVPAGKTIYFEMATCGFRFFKRSEHIRNAESLLYESAVSLKTDFVLEHIFCTRQYNFIFQFKRAASASQFPLDNLLVHGMASRYSDSDLLHSVFPESRITLSDDLRLASDAVSRSDAVLLISNRKSVDDLVFCKERYLKSGLGSCAPQGKRVLDDTVLISSRLAMLASDGLPIWNSDALKEIVEYNLILTGLSL